MIRTAQLALVAFALLMLTFGRAWAVLPDEVLPDPALEARARSISAELRCMVCQNQSIDDSDAELARDLRILVRDRLQAGDSDEEVMDYVVARYGEFVLLRPRFNLQNGLLWATPLLLLFIGAGALLIGVRKRRRAPAPSRPLSAEEERSLEKILSEREDPR